LLTFSEQKVSDQVDSAKEYAAEKRQQAGEAGKFNSDGREDWLEKMYFF
jgi:hypothetical protein